MLSDDSCCCNTPDKSVLWEMLACMVIVSAKATLPSPHFYGTSKWGTCLTERIFSRRAVVSYWRKYVHEVLVNRLGGLSLPRKSVFRLTYRPDMTLDVYRGRKTTIQQQQRKNLLFCLHSLHFTLQPFSDTVGI